MSLSAHLIEQYEDRKPFIGDLSSSFARPPHLAIPRSSTPSARPPSRSVNQYPKMDPDQSWMSHHGQEQVQQPSFAAPSNQGNTQWSEERIQMMQARLRKKLGPEYISQRQGPAGGGKLSYIEGWKVINLANDVFGFNGWSSSIVSLKTDYLDEKEGGRTSINVTAIIRITLADGTFHEDVGCGQGENLRGKSAALDKAQKEAVTDATKRALRTFGNMLGNCLYDKDYTKEVTKIRVPPAKFNQNDLERRPEFAPAAPATSGPSAAGPSTANINQTNSVQIQQPQPIRPATREPPIVAPVTPLRSINDTNGDVYMEENFDAEFLDIGSDSFLDQIEETSIQAGPSNANGHLNHINGQAGPSKLPQQAQQTYQHRHRPDPPVQAQTHLHVSSTEEHTTIYASETKQSEANGSKPSSGSSAESGSGASVKALPDIKPRPVGGFAIPATTGTAAATTAATARRQAMAQALNAAKLTPSPPIRAESPKPKIPSGGIDNVASRAVNKLRNDGVELRLDESGISEQGENVTMGGFTSARGVKRMNEDRRSMSPTKPPSANGQIAGQVQGGYNKQAGRTALGELTTGPTGSVERGGNDWAAKRNRVG
ncbi:uncharacterized protein I303_103960 [Kwoniella dejecticola CBS 10117]|uniref:DNA repair and recombination protein RAD52 n=1 Tax=Kwoniella dejecticola CBS 10117 TaxID=1296121 RepID=A0A1A6A874_9TREE|nr:uncharacterized protein I303_03978 [Kwoniella dejecticola CBS 10117]OBR86257.1 hypothetical protein I303_03978 [Kwoniella dejecticola CBS 10117]